MSENSIYKTQKTEKPKIETIADQLLEGECRKGFEEFLDFMYKENIRLSWAYVNGYNANYKGKRVGRIYIGEGEKQIKNRVHIVINTAERDKFCGFLEGQTDEVVELFMESISNKCIRCSPNICAKKFELSDKIYQNVCFGLGHHAFRFVNSSDDMQTMSMLVAGRGMNGTLGRSFSKETVKKLMIVRKEYIAKMLSLGVNPGTGY